MYFLYSYWLAEGHEVILALPIFVLFFRRSTYCSSLKMVAEYSSETILHNVTSKRTVIFKQEALGRTNHLLWHDTDRTENDAPNYSILACVSVASATFLSSRCLETIGGYTYRHTHTDGRGLWSTPIYIPSFIKIGSAIQKLIRVDTQIAWSNKFAFIISKQGK
jgi:hypothetical protein